MLHDPFRGCTPGVRADVGEDDYIVLIMDEVTTKVVSSACTMLDLGEPGVSLVEDVLKK